MRLPRGLARRAGWGLADQAFSSLTNVALGIVVARSVSPAEFGAYSLAFASYLLLMGIVRAVSSQPLVIRFSTVDDATWRDGVRRSTGAAVAIGVLAGLLALAVSAITSGALRQAYLGLALTLPGLLLQDCWRFAFFAKGDGKAAFLNDFAWALVMFPVFAGLIITGRVSVFAAVLGWGLAATVAALYGMLQARVRPALSGARSWVRDHRDVIPSYLGEYGATAGSVQVGLFGVGAVASLAVVGALRAAEIVFGPVRSLFQGVRQVTQPEAVRALAAGRNLIRGCLALSVSAGLIALIAGTLLLLIPDAWGRAVLNEAWDPAQPVLLPMTFAIAGVGMLIGAQMGLHALVAVRRTLVSRIVLTAMLASSKIVGAAIAGAVGAATASAIANWLGVALWWWQFAVAYREHAPAAGGDATEVDVAMDDVATFGQ